MTASPLSQLKDPTLLKTDALINGQWVKGACRFDIFDPATGHKLADVANLGSKDAEAAIAAANAAWPAWKAKTAKERSIILRKWFDLLMANQDDIARIMTAEQGKPLAEAKGEVAYGASFVEWFAEEAKRVNGETLPQFDNNRRLMVLKQPIGVCAAITPWNFPLAMITRKVAPALAAGCPVVIKPAELTPLTALAAAELAMRAGIPAGVLNMISADANNSIEVGKVICASPVVRHLSFTGSTEVGRILMAQSAPTVKKLSLELGGNAPFWCLMMPTLTAPSKGRLQASTVMRVKPASAPTACMFRPGCTSNLSKSSPPKSKPPKWAMALMPRLTKARSLRRRLSSKWSAMLRMRLPKGRACLWAVIV
jgi:succinate-semialdehyde dehydrogenase/glutarate-semialdehyde dehydrogenase